ARAAPLSLAEPLPVAVDPGQHAISLTVAAGDPLLIHARPGAKLKCTIGGVAGCTSAGPLPASTAVTLEVTDDMPVLAVLARESKATEVPVVRADPSIGRLASIGAGQSLYLDFERGQQRSLLVDVKEPGLYDLETEGLLATACRLRTPTVSDLVAGSENGRGRNCLVQGYLKPGQYLFSASASGDSRGRAGITLVKRPPRDLGSIGVDDELFFKVEPGELAQQTLDVKKGGSLSLSASGQGATLSCRVDDHDGWPLLPVPAPCDLTQDFEAGRYLLTVLPLTVPSQRRTALTRTTEPVVLSGEKTHPLALNVPAQAQLGTDGKDSFSFTLATDLDVGVDLDHGMQGHIYKAVGNTRGDLVDTVPPASSGGALSVRSADASDAGDAGDASEGESDDGAAEQESTAPSEDQGPAPEEHEEESAPEMGENEGGEGEGGDDAENRAQRQAQEKNARNASAQALAKITMPVELPALTGHVAHLSRGNYILETEHSRGDVAIRYGIALHVRELAPAVVMDIPVPGRVDVEMPRIADGTSSGLLRIKSHGSVDVRCRLRDATGALVAESADSGADWNCAMAAPLPGGKYSLTVEAEALKPGTTHLQATYLEAKDTGPLK
ncbi:MAG TPA: hypothetical protein VGO62_15325, partial [Myxococcota bacterium]